MNNLNKVGELLQYGYNILKNEDIESYIIDTQLLLCKVLNKERIFILTNKDFLVNEKEKEAFISYIEKRKNKMPVKYILEQCEFMGIPFFIKEGVLIPRGDTEILVEEVISEIKKKGYRDICDLCSGSGAIGLSILRLVEDVCAHLIDISEKASFVTMENIKRLHLENKAQFIKSDLLKEPIKLGLTFDVLVSNPPYIKKEEVPKLMKDVKDYEPYIALCGGEDGLDFYRRIIKESREVLRENGLIAFEIGHDQKEAVIAILKEWGYKDINALKDLSGKDRVITAKR